MPTLPFKLAAQKLVSFPLSYCDLLLSLPWLDSAPLQILNADSATLGGDLPDNTCLPACPLVVFLQLPELPASFFAY